MRSLRISFIMVVRQMGVEEPNTGIIELKQTPSDVTWSIIIPWDAHISALHKAHFLGIEQHVVLASSVLIRGVTRNACQSVPVLALLKPDDCRRNFLDLRSITCKSRIV